MACGAEARLMARSGCPVARFQMSIRGSATVPVAEASALPSGAKASRITGARCPFKASRFCPRATSHRVMSGDSYVEMASVCPSGENLKSPGDCIAICCKCPRSSLARSHKAHADHPRRRPGSARPARSGRSLHVQRIQGYARAPRRRRPARALLVRSRRSWRRSGRRGQLRGSQLLNARRL